MVFATSVLAGEKSTSAKEVAANGISLGKMQAKLLQKIEELTLYVIDINKENKILKEKVSLLEEKNKN